VVIGSRLDNSSYFNPITYASKRKCVITRLWTAFIQIAQLLCDYWQLLGKSLNLNRGFPIVSSSVILKEITPNCVRRVEMSNQAVEVEIFGKITRVNCPAGQEESLRRAAQRLDDNLKDMAEKTKITNEVQLLTFVALNFCHELESRDTVKQQQQDTLTERMELLAASLDGALSKVKPGKQ
jgi:cell division protein ZapA